MNTITYRELVKLIHPDLNPDISDPGGKMRLITIHKNDPARLFQFAVNWGLITPNYSFSHQEQKTNNGSHGQASWFTVGDVIVYKQDKRGVIVDISVHGNHYKILFADIVERKILYFFHKDGIDRENKKVGKCNQVGWMQARKLYNKYLDKVRKKQREEETRSTLRPNRFYWDQDVWILSKTHKWYVRVTRTTRKRVYYWDYGKNKERYVHMASVIHIRW